MEALKPKKGQYSFPSASREVKIVVPEVRQPYPMQSITPGPGVYQPKLVEIGNDGPKYTIHKQKAGYSYLPNSKLKCLMRFNFNWVII